MATQPQPLQFARGVRLAREDDLPKPKEDALQRLASARITTGYIQKPVTEDGFSDYFEFNVHAANVWEVFRVLADAILPEISAPIICWKDGEAVLGPYTNKHAALGVFEPYVDQLVNDGFIEFGIMFQQQGKTEEVLVRPAKDFRVWTNKPDQVKRILQEHQIPRVFSLQFIDEYPRVTEALRDSPFTSMEVIDAVKLAFRGLPER